MRASKLVVGSFLFVLGSMGCSDDPPATTPPPDSGNPKSDTGTPGDNDGAVEDAGETIPPGDMRPCEGSTIAVGTTSGQKITHNGVEYSYIVHVPPSYDGTKRTPLVVNWPGANATSAGQQIFSQADVTADAEGFIVVYPAAPDLNWAGGTCCLQFKDGGDPNRDDVGFARALVAQLSSVACIDSKKVYAMGMSNGAFMVHRLACEAADQFAAGVAVAGKMGVSPCAPSRPFPIMHFHGTADVVITYDSRFSAEGVDVPTMMANWATRDGCTKGPETTFQKGNATCKTWSQCSGGSEVKFCSEEGDGHCWPGASFCLDMMPWSMDISATQDGWKFLRRFALP